MAAFYHPGNKLSYFFLNWEEKFFFLNAPLGHHNFALPPPKKKNVGKTAILEAIFSSSVGLCRRREKGNVTLIVGFEGEARRSIENNTSLPTRCIKGSLDFYEQSSQTT